MAQHKAKRPGSAHHRTLPPDAPSLEQMVRSVHRQVLARASHLKAEAHDFHARRGFQSLLEQRAGAWSKLESLDPSRAERVRTDLHLIISSAEVT